MNSQRVRSIVRISLAAAILCILAPISIPIPFTSIPVSLTILILCLLCYLVGYKTTLIAYIVYFILGIVGLPVFSNFSGGLAKIAGPTGGYIIGFFFLIIIAGPCIEKANGRYKIIVIPIIGMLLGVIISYLFGAIWYVLSLKTSIWAALTICVFPFIPFDIIKIILCAAIGNPLRKRLQTKES